jgi:hypothetical protein
VREQLVRSAVPSLASRLGRARQSRRISTNRKTMTGLLLAGATSVAVFATSASADGVEVPLGQGKPVVVQLGQGYALSATGSLWTNAVSHRNGSL